MNTPQNLLLVALISITLSRPFGAFSQAVNTQDSLALVDLYNSTNGPNWVNNTNWLTTAPVSNWYGVAFADGSQVRVLALGSNHLVGTIPSSLGNMSLWGLSLNDNQLTGSIPTSFNNLPGTSIDLSNNQLSGVLPAFNNIHIPSYLNIPNNRYNFSSFAALAFTPDPLRITPQADLPLIVNGNILSVAAGGKLAHNTYTWYKDGNLLVTKTGDSTLTTTATGNYTVSVTNSDISGLTLYSISTVNIQDSLALVDLYNSTSGANWLNNSNWLTTMPVGSWHGITVRNQHVTGIELSNNNLTGPISSSLGNLAALYTLIISGNKLSGSIPAALGNLSALTAMGLGGNQLTGSIPSELGNLTNLIGLGLSQNKLSGAIPASLGNLTGLNSLFLSQNNLSGRIPASFGNFTLLSGLYLAQNQLSGPIPGSLGNLAHADVIDMSNNQLSDSIPSSLGSLSTITQFYANNNQLSGPIPNSFSNLTRLSRLGLANNKLTGNIPDSLGKASTIGPFAGYQMFDLQLQNNLLSGPIPLIWLNFQNLTGLRIDSNHFTFAGMENIPDHPYNFKKYAPQANIPLIRKQGTLSVNAGGTLANNTYSLYKDGVLVKTQTGDSTFPMTGLAKYNIVTTNSIATQLTLYSDTVGQTLVLPDSSIADNQTITTNTPTDFTNDIFKLVTLTAAATPNGLSGPITVTESIDDTVTVFNGLLYLQRHYDITPANNASTAQATVTLYFAQQDFDSYNNYITTHNLSTPLLPSNGIDNGNIRITQYHGSFTGTAAPGNYNNGVELITPIVAWDATNEWWSVSFPVTGFSGFFLTTGITPLPLTLLQFTGAPQGMNVRLQWQTTQEKNTKQFIIQRSAGTSAFAAIGTVPARSTTGQNNYSFTDADPRQGNNNYRLKMQDANGEFTYSPTIAVNFNATATTLAAWPNPIRDAVTISFTATTAAKYTLRLTDPLGRTITQKVLAAASGANRETLDCRSLAPGIYTVTLITEGKTPRTLQITKQ